uniref:CYtochrome P450 family n=1 Tax=Caenorhabditis tropicalis TaxID=1561998 RepID=A0A1I7UBW0_9PELO
MFVFLFLTVLTIYLGYELYWKRKNFPPGPCPLPVFGNLLSLNSPPPGYEAFEKWTKKYGSIYTFWIGSTPHIMISSYDKIKETFIRDADTYTNKVHLPATDLFRGGKYGVIDSNGERWRDHRRFALSTFRDLGFGKNLMQEKILLEVEDIFSKFDSKEGEETDIPLVFDNAIANVINQLLFGYRFDESKQEEFNQLKKIIDDPPKIFGKLHIFLAMNIPIIAKILPESLYETQFKNFRDSAFGFFQRQIDKHRKEIDFDDLDSETSDYVERYLKEQKQRKDGGETESFSDVQLSNMCMDLWFAGLGTTTNTTTWALSYLLHYPNIQKKLQKELDKVIGSERLITTADKNDLPYMNAFINESQRCVNLVPLNLQHETTKDTVINGYCIPKGTGVVAQISTVMNDEKTFPDHKSFNPDRFIDENGKLKKVEELIPFSAGKRQCLGEGLARMELFLFISNFINRYTLSPSKEGPPSLEKTCTSMVEPRVFSGVLKRRRGDK